MFTAIPNPLQSSRILLSHFKPPYPISFHLKPLCLHPIPWSHTTIHLFHPGSHPILYTNPKSAHPIPNSPSLPVSHPISVLLHHPRCSVFTVPSFWGMAALFLPWLLGRGWAAFGWTLLIAAAKKLKSARVDGESKCGSHGESAEEPSTGCY